VDLGLLSITRLNSTLFFSSSIEGEIVRCTARSTTSETNHITISQLSEDICT
jgi:hypothetical protein